MLMVPNFQPRRSGVVINLILIVKGVEKIVSAGIQILTKARTNVDTLVPI